MPAKPPVHRPAGVLSAAEVKRALDRQRPSAARRGYGPRSRRARAAFLARHPLCAACRAQGRVVPATVVDHVMPHRGDQTLFWDEANWGAGLHALPRCEDRARGPLGLIRAPGGRSFGYGKGQRGPAGPSPVYAREIQEGGMRPLFGGSAEFQPLEAHQSIATL